MRIVDGVEVDRPNCGANAPNAEHDETVYVAMKADIPAFGEVNIINLLFC